MTLEQPGTRQVSANSMGVPVSFMLETDALDVEATLDGGQSFRWWRVGGLKSGLASYDGIIGRTAVRITEVAGGVSVEARSGEVPEAFPEVVSDYLGIRADLGKLLTAFKDDPCIGPAMTGFPGLRLLRQDPWECLVSFICSSTSNIPRIKLNVGSVARELGQRIGPGDADFAFPDPAIVAASGEQFLRDLGLGFRAKFIIPAAEKVASGDLDLFALRETPYYEARAKLVALNGVGEKIADCVLAFSLDKPEAFPIDRHIRRALENWYQLPSNVNNSQASDFARAHFGQHGALAQQYMFHRERLSQRAKWGGSHVEHALPEDRLKG
ncbi:MAG: DNA glycosylase [Chloroflexi bacterium]|nr:DNA glycosylase [Chloroflexota bacterium]